MNLKAVAVSRKLKEYSQIKGLLRRAFPREEEFPMWLLRVLAIRESVDFLAYYDADSFCGLSYSINSKDLVFVLYLAVNEQIRSRGYGSAILQFLKQKFPDKQLALNIELLEPDSEDYAQRVKRFAFYVKNGFVDTQYQITDHSGTYQILAATDDFSAEAYKSAIKQLSFGLYASRVEKQTN